MFYLSVRQNFYYPDSWTNSRQQFTLFPPHYIIPGWYNHSEDPLSHRSFDMAFNIFCYKSKHLIFIYQFPISLYNSLVFNSMLFLVQTYSMLYISFFKRWLFVFSCLSPLLFLLSIFPLLSSLHLVKGDLWPCCFLSSRGRGWLIFA